MNYRSSSCLNAPKRTEITKGTPEKKNPGRVPEGFARRTSVVTLEGDRQRKT